MKPELIVISALGASLVYWMLTRIIGDRPSIWWAMGAAVLGACINVLLQAIAS